MHKVHPSVIKIRPDYFSVDEEGKFLNKDQNDIKKTPIHAKAAKYNEFELPQAPIKSP